MPCLALSAICLLGEAPGASTSRPVKVPPACWAAERAEKLEKSLDAFFAETSAEKRRTLYEKELAGQQVGLTIEELETIAKAAPPDGKPKRGVWKIQCPWLKGKSRGWFNFSMPADYTPKKAWPLAIAMHGSSSDGNNVVSWYTPALNKAGYFVIYPTTTSRGGWWASAPELVNIYRIIDWAARRYRIDFRRLAATGGSMGGCGTWSFLMGRPDIWSVGASASGYPTATEGDILENIRGIPFYFIHGDKDHIPVSGPRKASAELKRRKIDHVYVEVPGGKHTLPRKHWSDMIQWIAKQPPKPSSPRPLFLPASPNRPIWQVKVDPLAFKGESILEMIREGRRTDALRNLGRRLAKEPGNARLLFLRAMANLPGLVEPYPYDLDPKSFDPKKGWTTRIETVALGDLTRAISAKTGKGEAPKEFDVEAHLMRARIYAKRTAVASSRGGVLWHKGYKGFDREIREVRKLVPGHPEANRLVKALLDRVRLRPKRRK